MFGRDGGGVRGAVFSDGLQEFAVLGKDAVPPTRIPQRGLRMQVRDETLDDLDEGAVVAGRPEGLVKEPVEPYSVIVVIRTGGQHLLVDRA